MGFKSLLNSLCTIQSLSTSQNALGETSNAYSSGTQVICRFNPFAEVLEGETADRVSFDKRFKVFLENTSVIDETSRMVSKNVTYNVLRVSPYDNATRQHHKEVVVEAVS